jgi:hypothetical protein
LKETLTVKLYVPLGGKNGAMIGVNIGTPVVIEMVTMSPGPPALPAPPLTLEMLMELKLNPGAAC